MSTNKPIFYWQLYAGILLVLAGSLFLIDQWLDLEILANFWPLLIVLFGLIFIITMLLVGRKGAGLAIPGVLIMTLGVLFFFQSRFNLWITWAYAWTIMISATGLGLLMMNAYLKRDGVRRAAGVLVGLGLALFVTFGILFEVILKVAGINLQSGIFLGAGLVLLGLFVVFSRVLFFRKAQAPNAQPEPTVVDATFQDQEPSSYDESPPQTDQINTASDQVKTGCDG